MVSVIGDSTFVHSGIPGLVEMVYNPPPGGHVVLILDNGTTAMTGLQEHPGTGRTLDHAATGKIDFEDLIRALGIPNVTVVDPVAEAEEFEQILVESLNRDALSVIITRRTCLLAAGKIRQYEQGAMSLSVSSISSSPGWAARECSRLPTSSRRPPSPPAGT